MQNAILGMRYLNVSQGYFSNYTHKNLYQIDLAGMDSGIDTWRAKMYLKCLNILRYETTGFANTVFFGTCDKDGNMAAVHTPGLGNVVLTLAMTHDNVISSRIKIGGVYSGDDMIYEEGIKGNATGNHIHLEVTTGLVTNKIKYTGSKYSGGLQWGMPNLVPPEKALFLLRGYNETPIDTEGYDWQWVDSIEYGGDTLELKEGRNDITFNGKEYRIVKQPKNTDVMIWSYKHPNLYALTKMNDGGVKPLFAKNLSFFQMNGSDKGYIIGSEISDLYDEAVPTSQNLIDVVKLKDGTWKFGNFGPYQYRKDECSLRYSTGMVLVAGGVYSEEYSAGIGASARQEPVEMSATFVDWNNDAYMVASMTKVTHAEMRNLAMELNMQYAFRDDSGGSTCIVQNGVAINNYEGRALPNALVFIPKAETPVDPEEPEEPVEETVPKSEYDALNAKYEEVVEENTKLLEINNEYLSIIQNVNNLTNI